MSLREITCNGQKTATTSLCRCLHANCPLISLCLLRSARLGNWTHWHAWTKKRRWRRAQSCDSSWRKRLPDAKKHSDVESANAVSKCARSRTKSEPPSRTRNLNPRPRALTNDSTWSTQTSTSTLVRELRPVLTTRGQNWLFDKTGDFLFAPHFIATNIPTSEHTK